MTREEFFEKYHSLQVESNELTHKRIKVDDECLHLLYENAEKYLGIKTGSTIVEKENGCYWTVTEISIDNNKNEFRIYIEPCVDIDYIEYITESEFREKYMLKEEWKKMQKKQKEKEYKEYLKPKAKFEKKGE